MGGNTEQAEGEEPLAGSEDDDYIDILTPEDMPEDHPPEPHIFKWTDRRSGKKYRISLELRWPDDLQAFQMAYQDAEQDHFEALRQWKRGGKKPTEKPPALWGHYRLIRRTLITKPTWFHNDAAVANMPQPVTVQFHGALLSRALGGQDFRVDTGLRSEASEALKEALSISVSEDGSEPSPEISENGQTSTSESSSTPPSEPKSEESGSTESTTPSTPAA